MLLETHFLKLLVLILVDFDMLTWLIFSEENQFQK